MELEFSRVRVSPIVLGDFELNGLIDSVCVCGDVRGEGVLGSAVPRSSAPDPQVKMEPSDESATV